MAVGDDDLRDGLAEAVEDDVPGVPGGVEAVAGVDDRHTVAVLDEPQVDVVQCEGQRHANPVHAGGDRQGFADGRQGVEGIFQLRGHGLWVSGVGALCLCCVAGRAFAGLCEI